MIRLIIVVLLLLIFAVFSLIALPILWLIGKKNPVVKEKASDAVARFMFRLILFVFLFLMNVVLLAIVLNVFIAMLLL